jgi:hypothetical protein
VVGFSRILAAMSPAVTPAKEMPIGVVTEVKLGVTMGVELGTVVVIELRMGLVGWSGVFTGVCCTGYDFLCCAIGLNAQPSLTLL